MNQALPSEILQGQKTCTCTMVLTSECWRDCSTGTVGAGEGDGGGDGGDGGEGGVEDST